MPYDVAVVGAGSFGAWTALRLHEAGCTVLLVDAYGPANSRASSGGESRIIRMGYGGREVYTRWSIESMGHWRTLADETDSGLLVNCGALWIAASDEPHALETMSVFTEAGVAYEALDARQLRRRYPHFRFDDEEWAVYEPDAGGLLARRAVQTLVRRLIEQGVRYEQRHVQSPAEVESRKVVFACGPWLPRLFPVELGKRILPSRQEVLFFGVPPGSSVYGPSGTPCWIDIANTYYGLPDLENRGFKVALDKRGPLMDPDTAERTVGAEAVQRVRGYLARRVPELANAPLVEARVCQYENTATSDYILDRHPAFDNVWIAGGGSGHGFKHGPSVGSYMKELVLDGRVPDERFRIDTKPEFTEMTSQSSL
ncbi:MAG: FAD-dependent oxidoreductase [Acidobacteria bacterium]|nr:FAD-dependent oxidoreductase [Acidobacteriota bacterium]